MRMHLGEPSGGGVTRDHRHLGWEAEGTGSDGIGGIFTLCQIIANSQLDTDEEKVKIAIV